MQLQSKVAFITGASSGIGAATAKLFAREGARIAVLGRTPDHIEAVVSDIRDAGGEALFIAADVADAPSMGKAVAQTVERFGGIDIVFANAGINGVWAPIEELTPEEWDKTVAANGRGTFLTLKTTFPHLKTRFSKPSKRAAAPSNSPTPTSRSTTHSKKSPEKPSSCR